MKLIDRLHSLTGLRELEELKPQIRQGLITRDSQRYDHTWINSGALNSDVLGQEDIHYLQLFDFNEEDKVKDWFKQGRRMQPTLLSLSPAEQNIPHCHPGGELAYIIEGDYFDADMKGNPIQAYTKGETVIYTPFSTHRPLTNHGAKILYIPFDGIIFGKDAEILLQKMENAGAHAASGNYAKLWMNPEE